MELWIMTAWQTDNHPLTCPTHSWTAHLSAQLLLSLTLFASVPYLPPCTQLFVSVLCASHSRWAWSLTVFVCAGVYLSLTPSALSFLSPAPLISCVCSSSSSFVDQAVQCDLMSLCRELRCIVRWKPADRKNTKKETEPERLVNRTIAWSFFALLPTGTDNRHFALASLHSSKSNSVLWCSLSLWNHMLHFLSI